MAILVKYGDLKGEVKIAGYDNGWFEVDTFQWGVGRSISSGVGGGSKREATAPAVSEVTLTKTMDEVSPLLLKEAVGGVATKVLLHITQTDKSGKHIAFQKYIFERTLVSSYSLSGHAGSGRPTESFTLNFTKFDSEYINIDDKFATKTTGHVIYDVTTGKMG